MINNFQSWFRSPTARPGLKDRTARGPGSSSENNGPPGAAVRALSGRAQFGRFDAFLDRPRMRGHESESIMVEACMPRADAIAEGKPIVIIVDDDAAMREALGSLVRSVGLEVRVFASIPDFLEFGRIKGPTCLVLDVRLPGQSGLDFQRELSAANIQVPIIFITAHADVPMSVQAMKGGAIEFLAKPFRDQDFLDAIQLGLARDRARHENERAMAALRDRFETLSPREREVMARVVKGRLNKQIAADIGVSEVTVKVHRGQVMRKMKASSLPDLARMADKLTLASGGSKA